MTNYLVKLRLVFVPFLLFLLATIVVYTFLHWLLVYRLQLFELKQSLVCILIPAILIILFALPLLGSRLQFLHFRFVWLSNVVLGLAMFLITFSTATIQYYMVLALSGNTVLQTIAELPEHNSGRFYTIAQGHIATDLARHHFTEQSRRRGKFGRRVTDLQLYVVAPIVAAATDTTITPKAWLGKTYKATIKKHKADNTDRQRFISNSLQQFATEDFRNYSSFEKTVGSTDADMFKAALKQGHKTIAQPILLEPKYQPFEVRQQNQLLLMLGAFAGALISWVLVLIVVPLNKWNTRVLFMIKSRQPQTASA